jgi:hypothetical protein
MQVRVTVELQGEPDEVGLLLTQLGETMLLEELDVGDEDEQEQDEVESRLWWTSDRAAAFVRELTPPALQALSVIASHPPRLSFREFQRRMGMSGPQLAGRLSSIGFTVARQGTPFPFVRDYYQKLYIIDEGVATVMREAAAAETARRRAEERDRVAYPGRLADVPDGRG